MAGPGSGTLAAVTSPVRVVAVAAAPDEASLLCALAAALGAPTAGTPGDLRAAIEVALAAAPGPPPPLVLDGVRPAARTPALMAWLAGLPIAVALDAGEPNAEAVALLTRAPALATLAQLPAWDDALAAALLGEARAAATAAACREAERAGLVRRRDATYVPRATLAAAARQVAGAIGFDDLAERVVTLLERAEPGPSGDAPPRWRLRALDLRPLLRTLVDRTPAWALRQRAALRLHARTLLELSARLPIAAAPGAAWRAPGEPGDGGHGALTAAAIELLAGRPALAYELLHQELPGDAMVRARRLSLLVPLELERGDHAAAARLLRAFDDEVAAGATELPLLAGEALQLRAAVQAALGAPPSEVRQLVRQSVHHAHAEPALIAAAWRLFAELALPWTPGAAPAHGGYLTFRTDAELVERDDCQAGLGQVQRGVDALERLPIARLLQAGQLISACVELAVALALAADGELARAEGLRLAALVRLDRLEREGQLDRALFDHARALWAALTPTPVPAQVVDADLAVGLGGDWFKVRGGEPVVLRHRRVLRSLLGLLLDARVAGAPVPGRALIAALWPGERAPLAQLKNRLAVQLSQLRDLGLRPWLQITDGGYWIDPRARVVVLADGER